MQHKELHDGRKIPVLGLGTATLGSDPARRERDEEAMRTAIELGYKHIDTAEIYGGGASEELIGRTIRDLDRSELFITSKVAKRHLRRDQVREAIHGSLRRLNTDYLDLYLIHAPNPEVPLEETFEALNELVARGKTKYIGVSNVTRDEMDKAYRLTHSLLATNQVHYNLLHREPEQNGVLQFCQDADILLTAYSPLEVGDVVDHERIQEVAQRHGVTPAQLALAWLIQKPKVITIVQSRDDEHLEENLAALDLKLTEEDLQQLDRLEAGQRMPAA